MLITNLLKKIFFVVGTGLLALTANASTLTIDNFEQYDRAAKGPGSPMTVMATMELRYPVASSANYPLVARLRALSTSV